MHTYNICLIWYYFTAYSNNFYSCRAYKVNINVFRVSILFHFFVGTYYDILLILWF